VSDTWNVSIGTHYKVEPEPSANEKRAAEYLELLLTDRIDELIRWAASKLMDASSDLLRGVKGDVSPE